MITEIFRGSVSGTIYIKPSELQTKESSNKIAKIYRDGYTRKVVYKPHLYEEIFMSMLNNLIFQ